MYRCPRQPTESLVRLAGPPGYNPSAAAGCRYRKATLYELGDGDTRSVQYTPLHRAHIASSTASAAMAIRGCLLLAHRDISLVYTVGPAMKASYLKRIRRAEAVSTTLTTSLQCGAQCSSAGTQWDVQ